MNASVDKLATEGMKFTQFYTGAPVCAPARCVLLTGKHSGHAYIRNNGEVKPEGQKPIPAEEVTMGEVLKKDGYATAAVGKWGLGMVGTTGDPNKQGLDVFFGYNCQRHAHSYYPSYLWHNDKRVKLKNEPPVPGHASLPQGADPSDPRSYDIFKGQDYAPEFRPCHPANQKRHGQGRERGHQTVKAVQAGCGQLAQQHVVGAQIREEQEPECAVASFLAQ